MADVREEGFVIGLKGIKKGSEAVKKAIDWISSLSKGAEEAEKVGKTVSKVKLAPRQRL